MNVVQPIRDERVVEGIQAYFHSRRNQRDHVLFCTGIYTGLRISDMLKLRVEDVQGTHIVLREGKTNKPKMIKINARLRGVLDDYIKGMHPNAYLFPARSKKLKSGMKQQPLSRDAVYKMLNKAAKRFKLQHIGCHTMRKTFGYRMYHRDRRNLALLMELFNHSSETVTLRYIGITQDMLDAAVDDL